MMGRSGGSEVPVSLRRTRPPEADSTAAAGRRLPAYHVGRPRLVQRCLGSARVIVLEAAGGYGKSVLAAELVEAAAAVGVEVSLADGAGSARLLAGRLRTATAAAGFRRAARCMALAGGDAATAVDLLLEALTGESCVLVIDDAHHAEPEAGRLLARVAERIVDPQRLVVCARRLPAGTERLGRPGILHLTASDLALQAAEALELCHTGFGLAVDAAEAEALGRATGGWTAAAVLAASRARETREPPSRIARAAAARHGHWGTVAAILGEPVAALGSDRVLLAQLGRLPLLDRDLVDRLAGRPGFFDRALSVGLPLTPGHGAWWDLPGPVRDHLASLAPAEPGLLRLAASQYADRDELGAALQLLITSGDTEAATAMLGSIGPRAAETMDALELRAVVDRLPAAAVDRHPEVLLHLARSYEAASLVRQRRAVLDRVAAISSGRGPGPITRALAVERATDLVRDFRQPEAEALAREVLAEAPPDELLTRARALAVVGRTTCWHVDTEGRRQLPAMREAAGLLDEAVACYLELGLRAAAAGLAPYRAIWVEHAGGDPQGALEILNQGLALAVDRPRRWAHLLIFRAQVLAEIGRHDECETDIGEVLRVARGLRHPEQLIAYAHWTLMTSASLRGDAAAALEEARTVERHRGDWWEPAAADFLAQAADDLDRVGHVAIAREYLERAAAHPGDAQGPIAIAEGALLARDGDPVLAEERLRAAPGQRLDPREYWRVTLFRAFAAHRRGDPGAGALAARAFEEAARLGLSQLPLVRERELTEALLALAVETGQPAALALGGLSAPVAVSVLGRFELARGGRPVALGTGQATKLLKLVAVNRGRIAAERAIEALWPEADVESGRNRLRTVLNRLREAGGALVGRSGELLGLEPAVSVDLVQFHAEARRAIALGLGDVTAAVALARSAIARYRGDLLPDDLCEEWAEVPRETARRTMLDCLDLCASAAARSGDLDEARRVVERTIELAPYDDDRYLRAASLLLQQGRRGAALTVVRRAEAALSRLGLEPPPPLVELQRSIGA